jgi:SAM-dependent methyltransferase
VQSPDTPYTSAYFDSHVAGSLRSARAILPLVLDLVDVESAVDIGCGVGAWLSVLIELGVNEVFGIDGDYVEPKDLLIPERCFTAKDLAKEVRVERAFDLALSLEVAEHLPPERARSFVETLAGLAPVVLFSAAIPGQGGIGHVTERWPDYWAGLFAEHDYAAVDAVRYRIWTNHDVEPWYAQNALLFAASSALADSLRLRREYDRDDRILNVVHPRIFEIYRPNSLPPTTRSLLQPLPRAVLRSLGLAGARTRIARRLRTNDRQIDTDDAHTPILRENR